MEDTSRGRVGRRLLLVVSALSIFAGAIAQLPAALGLTQHDPDASALNAIAWVAVGVLWISLVARHARASVSLWRLPSALFRGGLAVGGGAIVIGHTASLAGHGPATPAQLFSSLEAALYELGVVALASLAAFASSRSLLRPELAGTRPPLGARDISLRTRVVVATTGASFATAGILLNVLIDFDTTPPERLAGFLATAAALVICSAMIGWLVGEDTARGVEAVTQRMRDLARSDRGTRIEVPVIAADEVGDLILAANELERRVREEEATAAATAERERIARELHDGVAKSVSVLSLDIASLAARAPNELQQPLARIEHLAQVLAEEVRAIVHEFRTRADPDSFDEALRRAVHSYDGATIEIDGQLERVGTLARFEVVRVLEEAVRNAARHASATHVAARLRVEEHKLRLDVEDDGHGIAAIPWSDLASQGHFGLLGMRERALLLNGDLRIEPRPDGGTHLALDIPLNGKTR